MTKSNNNEQLGHEELENVAEDFSYGSTRVTTKVVIVLLVRLTPPLFNTVGLESVELIFKRRASTSLVSRN